MSQLQSNYTIGVESSARVSGTVPVSPGTAVISLDRVTKRFHSVTALSGVSLAVQPGDTFGLLGPKGAGKSTLINLLLGFLHPDSGTIRLFGSTDVAKAHARSGYLPERARYHENFTGREYIMFHAALSGLGGRQARIVSDRALEALGLGPEANRRIRTYSRVSRQRLGLAVALASGGGRPPDLLLLDEPSSGLDVEGQRAVSELLADCNRRGTTVFLCSHQLTEVERICRAVGVLRGGSLVAQTRLGDSSHVTITAVARSGATEIASHLFSYLQGLHPDVVVTGGLKEGETLLVTLPSGHEVPRAVAMKAAALRALVDARWDITSLHVENNDLESLYIQALQPSSGSHPAKGKPAAVTLPLGVSESGDTGHDQKGGRSGPSTTPLTGPAPVPEAGATSLEQGTAFEGTRVEATTEGER